MSLNYSILPMLLDKKVRTVAVRFFADSDGMLKGKRYTYLTTHEFEKGDLAVVFVSEVPKVVSVEEMDTPTNDHITYKWIVDKVNVGDFVVNMESCQKLAEEVRRLEQENQRQQVMDALGLNGNEELKQIEFK